MMPDHVKALVGVDSLQDFETSYTPAQAQWREEPFREDFKKAMGSFVKGLCLQGTDLKLTDKITAMMLETPPWVGVSSMDELLKISYVANPPKIKAPIWCLNSDLWPTKVATNRKYVPEFNARIMPGVGHFLMLEKPDEFNQRLDDIIKEIEKTK
jgi:pimeloyl-ACP methyl ester carboxylesterase